MISDETCLSHPQRLWLSLSPDSWLLLYESQWVMLSALTVTEEGEVMRCCGKWLLESKQLKKCRFGNQKWKHKIWVWMAACWSTGFLSSSLQCLFCFYFGAWFLACFCISPPPLWFSSSCLDLMNCVVLSLAGRLKVIALASAVGVSAGLITLTVAIMIRWLKVFRFHL